MTDDQDEHTPDDFAAAEEAFGARDAHATWADRADRDAAVRWHWRGFQDGAEWQATHAGDVAGGLELDEKIPDPRDAVERLTEWLGAGQDVIREADVESILDALAETRLVANYLKMHLLLERAAARRNLEHAEAEAERLRAEATCTRAGHWDADSREIWEAIQS